MTWNGFDKRFAEGVHIKLDAPAVEPERHEIGVPVEMTTNEDGEPIAIMPLHAFLGMVSANQHASAQRRTDRSVEYWRTRALWSWALVMALLVIGGLAWLM